MFRKLKKYLPKSLFGRALMILLLPSVLAQGFAIYMFYERHWDNVSRKMAESFANEVALVYYYAKNSYEEEKVIDVANYFSINPVIDTNGSMVRASKLENSDYDKRLARNIKADFEVYHFGKSIVTVIDLGNDRFLKLYASEKRLFNSTTYIFILWMTGSTAILLIIAVIFLKNQIRPIIRLARLANNFGRGHEIPANFKPEGAREVKQAGLAYLNMMERLKRYVNQRTEMLAGISHDLRTPLTRMKLELEMLKSKDENIAELAADVAEMERMVQSYIEFVRGDEQEQPEEIALKDLLEDAASKYKDLEIKLTVNGKIKIMARPQAFKRAIVNLLDNARRYAKHVNIYAKVEMNHTVIKIDDDGPGIPQEQHEEVFKPFYRIEQSRNPETGGTGLGLSIVRDIINGHGGTVELAKSPKSGLRVIIKLPL